MNKKTILAHKVVYITIVLMILFLPKMSAQNSLEELLDQYNNESIPYISVETLKSIQNQVLLLDAREKKEYDISHIKHAKFVGYTDFKMDTVTAQNTPKDTKIVVYCSLGIRSEDISEKLKKAGYINVYNLYGGIFEWKNKDFPVMNSEEETTEEVHAFSEEWGKWLTKGEKIYSN